LIEFKSLYAKTPNEDNKNGKDNIYIRRRDIVIERNQSRMKTYVI